MLQLVLLESVKKSIYPDSLRSFQCSVRRYTQFSDLCQLHSSTPVMLRNYSVVYSSLQDHHTTNTTCAKRLSSTDLPTFSPLFLYSYGPRTKLEIISHQFNPSQEHLCISDPFSNFNRNSVSLCISYLSFGFIRKLFLSVVSFQPKQ